MQHNSKNPLVSVIIPTYKPERTIVRCIESILEQIYTPVEIIIVDSKDNPIIDQTLLSFIKRHSIYMTGGPERSIQRNRGIKHARGEFVYVVDQDMYLTKNVIRDAVLHMQQKNYAALTIPELSIGEGYWTECVALERYINNYLEEGLNDCCRFFRKKDILAIGGYDPAIVGAEDSDVHYKFSKLGLIGKITEHIEHDEGRTKFWKRVKKKYYYSKSFKLYLKRYPEKAVKQFSPIKLNYVKHWQYFVKKPHIALGAILLRGTEVAAGALGLLIKR